MLIFLILNNNELRRCTSVHKCLWNFNGLTEKKWLVIFNVRKPCRYYKFYDKVTKDSHWCKYVYEISDANKECH